MRIAQVATLNFSVPPKLYGGIERVVSYLTEELVAQGHEVTLFASGDSETSRAATRFAYLPKVAAKINRDAHALLFPIDWSEPFGLVMIESLACGTPVIAWRNGSVPEVIDDGNTGFIVASVEEAVRAVGRVASLSRDRCRQVFEDRFEAACMTRKYVEVYRRLVASALRTVALTV